MTWLRCQWAANGTKILGVALTLLAAIYTAADDILELIPRTSIWRGFVKVGFAVLGYFILRRGQGNTRRLENGPP